MTTNIEFRVMTSGAFTAAHLALMTRLQQVTGKTIVTATLAACLRTAGEPVLALKPVSTGDTSDARLLASSLGDPDIWEELTPWHFPAPIAPLLAEAHAIPSAPDVAGIAAGIVKMRMTTFLFSVWIGQLIKMTLFAFAGRY